jgi:hypothetical protein
MARNDRRQVEPAAIEAVRLEFMQPTESVFAHFVDVIRGGGYQVAQQLARLAGEAQTDQAQPEQGLVTWPALHAALPNYPADKLRRTLNALVANDILWQPAPEKWHFASLLFQQWLELNPV